MLTRSRLATLAVVTAIPLTIPALALAGPSTPVMPVDGIASDTATVVLATSKATANPYAPSGVGQGDNQGSGKAPDNGTIGNADDKNPPGQAPGGSDSNKGYECDQNKGVGDKGGNPAHSGCTTPSSTSTPTTSPKPSDSPKPSESPKPSKSPKTSESPKSSDSPKPTPTKSESPKPTPTKSATPTPSKSVTPPPPCTGVGPHPASCFVKPNSPKTPTEVQLPRTGDETTILVALGIGALASGAALTIAGRKEV